MVHELTATCARGLEQVLADELRCVGVSVVHTRVQAVLFRASLEQAYRVCLWSRVASRVLLKLRRVYAGSAGAMYTGIRKARWAEHVPPGATIAVHFVGTNRAIRNSHFGALRVKDAVVDSIRNARGDRPDVDTQRPDVGVHVYLRDERATVSIDLAGAPLHLRGHHRDGGPAPVKETLAAGLLRLAGWHELGPAGVPLVDPMCGSGTFLLEAADVLLDRAPGLARERWGFQGWAGHDRGTWERVLGEARARVREVGAVGLWGYDRDLEQVERTRANLERAGLEGVARVAPGALADLVPPPSTRDELPRGLLVTNPPYGERLGDQDEVDQTWRLLGDVLRRRFMGWTGYLLAGRVPLQKKLGLRPRRRHVVFNGPMEGRLLEVPIVDEPVARDRVG